jgi:opacity protein-like surface antigen
MRFELRNTVLISALSLITPQAFAGLSGSSTPSVYFGADAQLRNTTFKQGYGDNAFKKNAWQGNIYEGIKFNDVVGIEFGYVATEKTKKDFSVGPGDTSLGLFEGVVQTHIAKWNLKGWHVGLTGYLPLDNFSKWQAIMMVGMSGLKMKALDGIKTINGVTLTPYLFDSEKGKFSQSKIIPRLGAALEYQIFTSLSLRAGVIWEDVKKFRLEESVAGRMIKLKTTLVGSIGVNWTI